MGLYEFGPFQLDADSLLLLHGGEPEAAVGPKVVETLLALIEHPGQVCTKNELLERIWPEGYVEEANLVQNIHKLRKTLREHWDVDAIETVPRRGYRFVAPVREAERVRTRPHAPVLRRNGAVAAALAAALFAVVVLAGIAVTLAGGHRPVAVAAAPVALSGSGRQSYAIGNYYWNLRTRESVAKSLTYFNQIVQSDPREALGYAALAEANAIMGDHEYGGLKPDVYFNRAHAYAEEALAIDPNSAEAYAALGLIAQDRGQHEEAVADLQRALILDPKNGPAHEWYGINLLERGRLHEALRELRTSENLDPLSVATTAWLGSAAYLNHHFDDAIVYARQAIELSPELGDAYMTMGFAYEARGQYDLAIDAFKRYERTTHCRSGSGAAYLAQAYALSHRMSQAQRELSYAVAHRKNIAPQDLAVAFAAVGHKTIALKLLRHVDGTTWHAIANDPRFDTLRNDEQFRELARRAD